MQEGDSGLTMKKNLIMYVEFSKAERRRHVVGHDMGAQEGVKTFASLILSLLDDAAAAVAAQILDGDSDQASVLDEKNESCEKDK